MDFDLSDEQRLLADSVGRLLADHYPDLKARRAAEAAPDGWNRACWQALADLGAHAIPFEERHGGLGQGAVETMIVAEAMGRTLALEPFIETVVVGGAALRHGASETLCARLLPEVIAGRSTLALAALERQSRWDLEDVATTARQTGEGGYVIEGEKAVVLAGDSADQLVVSARLAGGRRDPTGLALFLVDARADGVTRRGYPTQDGRRAADITFAGVRVGAGDLLGAPGDGLQVLARAVDEGIAALAAEAVGAMSKLTDLTVEYLKTRKQFGVPIASFQALQHRAVDMFTHLEQARSMAYFATMMVAEADAGERSRAISAAKVQIGRSARFIGEQATQLHGGIGMTMEYVGGHYYKRLVGIDLAFGDADHHLARLAALGGLEAAV